MFHSQSSYPCGVSVGQIRVRNCPIRVVAYDLCKEVNGYQCPSQNFPWHIEEKDKNPEEPTVRCDEGNLMFSFHIHLSSSF